MDFFVLQQPGSLRDKYKALGWRQARLGQAVAYDGQQ